TVMQSMAAIVHVTFLLITLGITISFGNGNLWFGNWEYTFLNNVGFATQEDISPHINFAMFMLFQMMFCKIAISILS
ncbi:ammonium transporter, partial [Staphylococcus aureus]|nr:ammonium transporter [Staphylococcus aureus]